MKENSYEVIEWDERYLIVDEGTTANTKKVTSNLTEGEVKIIRPQCERLPVESQLHRA